MPRKPKKDETLEVRLPHETKHAFMERCKAEGRTASEAVRGFIEDHLARPFETKEPAMKFPRTAPVALAAAAAIAAVSVFAAQPSRAGPDLQAMFKLMDINGDGTVTAEEFANNPTRPKQVMFIAKRDDLAPALPPPGDREDFMLPLPPREGDEPPALPPGARMMDESERAKAQQLMFADIDANQDGKVSYAEFEGHHRALIKRSFARLDENGDGVVTQAEFKGPPLFTAAIRVEPGKPLPKAPLPAEIFQRLDKNKDGKISEKEYIDQG